MLSSRWFVCGIVLFCALLGGAASAYATTPPSQPFTIQSIDFEVAGDAVSASAWALPSFSPTPTAWWGRVGGAGQSSSVGLWCAGHGGAWPAFPLDTGGSADWQLPDTSALYESQVAFSYICPQPYYWGDLSLRLFAPGANPKIAAPVDSLVLDSAPVWTSVSLTSTSGASSLSANTVARGAVTLEFRFVDFERSGVVSPGATVDNLSVTGWRYGPVQGLVASRVSDTDVHVVWNKPHVSPGSSTEVTDAPTYRVWRHDLTAASWTELTSDVSRVADADRSITDTGATATHDLQYVVQAWGTGGQSTYYGRTATSNQVSPCHLTYAAAAHGTISGVAQQTVAYNGTGTAVTAVPANGYHFVSWSDGILTAERTDSNVQTDISVTASFAPNPYTLAYTAGEHGTISGTTSQTVLYGGAGTAVTAAPDAGYDFVSWSDGVTTATRTDTNVSDDVAVTASFAASTQFIGATGAPTSVAYGGVTTIAGTLVLQSSPDTTVTGHTVMVQCSPNGVTSWTDLGWASDTAAPGHYVAQIATTAKRYYRLHFVGDPVYHACDSSAVAVISKAYLTTPSAKSSVTHNKAFTVTGYLKTHHPRGAKSVVIKAYRYQSRKWVLRQTFSAVNSDYSSYTKYSASIKLKYAGKWRLYAYHADADHTATTSGYKSVTAK